MPTPGNEIICYDGRTLAVNIRPLIQVEARRGRRWGWFGQKGWWVHLSLFRGWHMRKFVLTLAESGVFLKYDPDYLPWVEEESQEHTVSSEPEDTSSEPPAWTSKVPF